MSQGPLCPNLTQKFQNKVSQMANHNLSPMTLLGGLSVNLNHLKTHERTIWKCSKKDAPMRQLTNIISKTIIIFIILS